MWPFSTEKSRAARLARETERQSEHTSRVQTRVQGRTDVAQATGTTPGEQLAGSLGKVADVADAALTGQAKVGVEPDYTPIFVLAAVAAAVYLS